LLFSAFSLYLDSQPSHFDGAQPHWGWLSYLAQLTHNILWNHLQTHRETLHYQPSR
jgi:hypothetical protein